MVIEYARHVAGTRGRVVERVRPRHRVPGHRDDGGAGRHPRPAATWAARCASACTRPISPRARSPPSCTARRRPERHRHRYEVNNRYRDQIAEAGLVVLGPVARPQPRRVRRAAARRAPVLHRHPGAPRAALAADRRRTRCSAASSAPRSSVTARASCSTSSRRWLAADAPLAELTGEPLRDEPVELEVARRATSSTRAGVGRPQRHRPLRRRRDRAAVRRPPRRRGDRRDGRRRPRAADPAVPASDPPSRLGDPGGAARHRGGVAARDRAARARPRRPTSSRRTGSRS